MVLLAWLCGAFPPLRPATGTGAEPPRLAAIAGEREGTYRYDDLQRFRVLASFTATIAQQGDTVQGKITELRSGFGPTTPSPGSDLSGAFDSETGTFSFRRV